MAEESSCGSCCSAADCDRGNVMAAAPPRNLTVAEVLITPLTVYLLSMESTAWVMDLMRDSCVTGIVRGAAAAAGEDEEDEEDCLSLLAVDFAAAVFTFGFAFAFSFAFGFGFCTFAFFVVGCPEEETLFVDFLTRSGDFAFGVGLAATFAFGLVADFKSTSRMYLLSTLLQRAPSLTISTSQDVGRLDISERTLHRSHSIEGSDIEPRYVGEQFATSQSAMLCCLRLFGLGCCAESGKY